MSKSIEDAVMEYGKKYENLDVKSASYNENDGTLTMNLSVKGQGTMPSMPGISVEKVSDSFKEYTSAGDTVGSARPLNNRMAIPRTREEASLRTIYSDPLTRQDLDLLNGFDAATADPRELYQKSIEYYKTKPIYGSTINILTNFASKGFQNDIDDANIKNFFDSWVVDTNFEATVEKIFFDFFRVGLVRTYKVLAKYEPKINYLSPKAGEKPKKIKKENAAAKKRYSKSYIPTAYTILNPTLIEIKGSLMFGDTQVYLNSKAGEEIKALLELPQRDLSPSNRKLLENLPKGWKQAIKNGDDLPLEQHLVGEVDYRRMPYERYPVPRATRVFESIQFKDELKKADYSTLDGISNYILKITVGSDQHPVTAQETLDRVGQMFDSVAKSFKVVWNHTLDVQKITSPEIGDILGQDKYAQVNEDITGGLGMPRPLIDGGGNLSPAAAEMAVKAVIEEINYARRQVKRWIYKEYSEIAEAMGFDRIPKVRFDDMALRDELQMMSIYQGMIDRRILSYRTGQEKLGFDFDTEKSNMEEELPLVQEGLLGLRGSPFQQSTSTQNVQGTPKGTPSEGRPKNQVAPTPAPKDKTKPSKPDKAAASIDETEIVKILLDYPVDKLEKILELKKTKK